MVEGVNWGVSHGRDQDLLPDVGRGHLTKSSLDEMHVKISCLYDSEGAGKELAGLSISQNLEGRTIEIIQELTHF